MNAVEITDIARRLYDAHGSAAIAEAAQKAKKFELEGNVGEAESWRRIETALMQKRGPRAT